MVFYHLTSFQNAQIIYKFGFKRGNSGMLGPGIYFAEKPQDTFKKAHSSVKDTIIVAELNTGRLVDVNIPHSDWNMNLVKSLGFDSVRKDNCRTGPEICVYESHRVKIIGVIHWDNNNIEFLINRGYNINTSEFNFLTNGKRVFIVNNIVSSCLECHFYLAHKRLRRRSAYLRGGRVLNG